MAFPLAVGADILNYEFELKPGQDRWVSNRFFASVDTSKGAGLGMDYFAFNFHDEKPVPAKFRKRSNGTCKISWAVFGYQTFKRQPQVAGEPDRVG